MAIPIVYSIIYAIANLVVYRMQVPVALDNESQPKEALEGALAYHFAWTFFCFFAPLLYAVPCGLAGELLVPDLSRLVLYMGATFMNGAFFEVLVGATGESLLGRKVWSYQIWSKHQGYTSGVGAVMWPMYGFYLCLLHETLRKRGAHSMVHHPLCGGLLIGMDAMLLETLANTYSLANYNLYYFYYLAPDLHHFTSAEIFLPYVLCGTIGLMLLKQLDRPDSSKTTMRWLGVVFHLVGLFEVFAIRTDSIVPWNSCVEEPMVLHNQTIIPEF